MGALNRDIARYNPAAAVAAARAQTTPDEDNQIEQWTYLLKLDRKYRKMDVEKARKQFNNLEENVQSIMRYTFGKEGVEDYLYSPPSAWQRFNEGLQDLATAPLTLLGKATEAWTRFINVPGLQLQQSLAGQEKPDLSKVLSRKTLDQSWDGRALYDAAALKKVEENYSAEESFIAKQILMGRNPAEIIAAYGELDDKFASTLSDALGNEDKWKHILDDFERAKLSPGRDLARRLWGVRTGRPRLQELGFTATSALTDAFYQVVIDPLTWITFGGSNVVTKPMHLAKQVKLFGAKGVSEAFNDPALAKLWDDIGPDLAKLKQARAKKDFAEAGNIRRKIADVRKGLDNDELINLLAESDVVDAASAKNFFRRADNWAKLVSGRVDNADYWRDGVAVSYKTQNQRDWINAQLSKLAQGKAEEVDASKLNKIVTGLREMGRISEGITPIPPHILESMNEQNRLIRDARKWISRHPGPQAIYIDDRVAQTIPQVRDLMRVLGYNKNESYATAEVFMASTQDERVEFLRGAYSAIMQKLGADDSVIQGVMTSKFFNNTGPGAIGQINVPEVAQKFMAQELPEQFVKPTIEINGPLHYSQQTSAIGAIPWDQIMQSAATNAFRKESPNSGLSLINATFQSKPVQSVTDAWNTFNLIFRNGMRTAIDHFSFGLLTLPRENLAQFVNGRRMQNVMTAITGSKAAVGPLKMFAYKSKILKGGPEAITDKMREEIHYAVQGFRSKDASIRKQSQKTLAKYDLSYSDALGLDSSLYIAKYAFDNYGKGLKPEMQDIIFNMIRHNPFVMEGSVQALTSRAANRMSDINIIGVPISRRNFDNVMEEYKDRFGDQWNTFTKQQIKAGNPNNWTVVWRRNATIRLNGNRVVLDPRDRNTGTLDLGQVFFRHNGLKTEKDFAKAVAEIMAISGFRKQGNLWVVVNRKRADKVLLGTTDTASKRAAKIDDGTIYLNRVIGQLSDIRIAFHGSKNGFNQELYDYVISNSIGKTPVEAFLDMDQKIYNELTENALTEQVVNTDFIIDGMDNPNDISKWIAFQDAAFELMDRQATGLYSGPAFFASKIASVLSWKKSNLDGELFKQLKDQGYEDDLAKEIADRTFEEITTREATGIVIKYIDNPMIRSQISYSIRNVGRYVRATEDFGRRIYRLKNSPLTTLYRVRLANQGLEASGAMYTDEEGERYFMFPGDSIIYKTLDAALIFVFGKNEFMKSTRYNDFTLKFSMISPSLQTDALRPTIASPVAGLTVVAIRNLLGMTNNATLDGWADNLDDLLLGEFGKDATAYDVLMPVQFKNIWRMLPTEERERQLASATISAISYMFDTKRPLNPDAPAKEKAEFQQAARVAAFNVLLQRFLLGMFFPATPTQQESVAIPDYFKAVGMTNMSQTYQSILQGVFELQKRDENYNFDPFEEALAIFIQQNPGRLIYTLPRSQKTVNTYFNQNEQVKNYLIRNQKFVSTYGYDAVLLFAPDMGKFERGAGKWFRQQGLIESVPVQEFLEKAQVANVKQTYFDLADERDRLLEGTTNFGDRQIIIESIEARRKAMRDSLPMLADALERPTVDDEIRLYSEVRQIATDQTFPMSKMTRARLQKMINIFDNVYGTLTRGEMPNEIDYSAFKATEKARAKKELRDLAGNDEQFMLINRIIFDPIMNYYSREVPSVGRGN